MLMPARCVKSDPDAFFHVAYARGSGAPLAASGTRSDLRERLRPTRPVKAQRVFDVPRAEMPSDNALRAILNERGLGMIRPQFFAAYRKGFKAAIDGESRLSNPYSDERTRRGSVTFSRAFRGFWRDGHNDGTAYRDGVRIP